MLIDKYSQGTKMNLAPKQPNYRAFQMFDKIFWVIWVAFPITFILIWRAITDSTTYTQGLTAQQLSCMKDLPTPLNFSMQGWIIYLFPLATLFAFYGFMIFVFHRMIRRFAMGAAFDEFTLRSMRTLGFLLIGYPFFELLLGYFVSEALQYTGDLKGASATYILDIGTLAAGFFVLALMYVLKNAIDLKSENDLTI
jgi:Protein of unknown function (DUF2975)